MCGLLLLYEAPTEAAPRPPLHYELHHPDVTPTVVLNKKKIRPPAIKFARPEPTRNNVVEDQ